MARTSCRSRTEELKWEPIWPVPPITSNTVSNTFLEYRFKKLGRVQGRIPKGPRLLGNAGCLLPRLTGCLARGRHPVSRLAGQIVSPPSTVSEAPVM